MSSKLSYHRRAERPVVQMWLFDDDGTLIDFSDPLFEFTFRIGAAGYQALLDKTAGIVGAAGSGTAPFGAGNITVYWVIGELDIEPGHYAWELVCELAGLERIYEGTIQILDDVL